MRDHHPLELGLRHVLIAVLHFIEDGAERCIHNNEDKRTRGKTIWFCRGLFCCSLYNAVGGRDRTSNFTAAYGAEGECLSIRESGEKKDGAEERHRTSAQKSTPTSYGTDECVLGKWECSEASDFAALGAS